MKNLFELQGSVALVTGGGQGLGRAICEGLAAYGAQVCVVDINLGAALEVAHGIIGAGGHASPVQCDVSQADEAEAAVDTALKTFGKIDVLVANAGIGDRSPAESMTIDQWDRVIAVNLRGAWLFDQAVGKHLIERKRAGSIINMASVAGQVGLTTGNANYAASKGAIIALTRCLAVEWARYGIRINAIAPTHFRTPLVAAAIERNPALLDYFLGNIPLGRLGEPQDIVGAAIFLASSASGMVTGHVLNVDGGHTAR
jgi:NAD(P)-dependent dehydrogenase (short-subunit alcohol dehydrogenase family)